MKWFAARRLTVGLIIAASLGLGAACGPTYGRLYVRTGPPAPIYDARIPPPGPGYVWIVGYHRWDGGRYVWVPGHWIVPPRARAPWIPGHWAQDNRGWYFVEGHWRY